MFNVARALYSIIGHATIMIFNIAHRAMMFNIAHAYDCNRCGKYDKCFDVMILLLHTRSLLLVQYSI